MESKAPHPYLSQHHPCAYPNDDGTYRIVGKTFHQREKLKAHRARWNPDKKCWIGSCEAAQAIGALIMTKARVAKHCHESEQVVFVNHLEVEAGYKRMGCGLCDTLAICGSDVAILEVIDDRSWRPAGTIVG